MTATDAPPGDTRPEGRPFTDRLLGAAPDLAAHIARQQERYADGPNPGSDDAVDAGCTCDRERNRDGEGLSYYELHGLVLFDIDPDCPMHGEGEEES